MLKEILQSIPGVELFPIISLLLLFTGFLAIVYFAFKIGREDIKYFSRLPLDKNYDMKKSDIVRINREENNG